MHRSTSTILATTALMAVTMLAPATAVPVGGAPGGAELAQARQATAPYHRITAATSDGYGLLLDAAGIACIADPTGAMGVHFVDLDLVLDGAVDAAAPEGLVYEPTTHGGLRLVAVEYVVFQDAWDADHTSRPSLFGQEFELVEAGNRYGLDPFYELHAWIWKHNPGDKFGDWNSTVSCSASTEDYA